MLLLERLLAHTEGQPNQIALQTPEATLSFGQLRALIEQTCHYLSTYGLQAGERVALQLEKGLPFILLHLAALRLGAISLPLNPSYPPEELGYFLQDAGAALFFGEAGNLVPAAPTSLRQQIVIERHDFGAFQRQIAAAAVQPLPALPRAESIALMIYTSGTTGRPKGAMLSHANLSANLDALHQAWGWQPTDRLLHALPIFHVHGLIVALHGALHAGATTIILPRFEAELVLETLVRERCTIFMGVPTMHHRLVEVAEPERFDLRHVRLITSGSDRLPDDLFYAFQQRFGHTLLERYGMSETGMNLSNPLAGERRIGSVGLPLPGVEARIADPASDQPLPDGEVGEVQIRGAHVFVGYWGMPEKTAESFSADGWFRTGDLGLREPDGYYKLQGRAKDLIISGGLNIYPPEVERVLAELPQIAASAVIGCPDREWGEQITAIVVLTAGAELSEAAIIAHCRARLATYKIPRRVIMAADLPRNALGKVQKAHLRNYYCRADPAK